MLEIYNIQKASFIAPLKKVEINEDIYSESKDQFALLLRDKDQQSVRFNDTVSLLRSLKKNYQQEREETN